MDTYLYIILDLNISFGQFWYFFKAKISKFSVAKFFLERHAE